MVNAPGKERECTRNMRLGIIYLVSFRCGYASARARAYVREGLPRSLLSLPLVLTNLGGREVYRRRFFLAVRNDALATKREN